MRHDGSRRSAALVLLLAGLLAPARPAGQGPAAGRAEPLLIDFQAIGRDGRPVADLRSDEVTLKIDGKTRVIRSLSLVQVGDPLTDARAIADAMPPPYGSNDSAEFGRNILIVIEDESIVAGHEANTKEALARFLARLGSRDRVGLVTVPHGGLRVGLTTNLVQVRQALGQFFGRGARDETAADAACRSRDTLQALASQLANTRASEGPLTVLFFSASMIGSRGAEAPTGGSRLQSRRCELTSDEFRKVETEATAAHAYLFVIQPDLIGVRGSSSEPATIGGSIPQWDSNPRTGLEHLAGITGGRMMQLAGPESDTLLRAGVETSAFYLASVEPDPHERNDNGHLLSVKTSRSGVAIYTRPDVIIPRPANQGVAAAPAAQSAADLLQRARIYRDLPLRGLGYASRGAGGGIMILSLLEAVDRQTLVSAAVGAYDLSGRLVAQWIARDEDLAHKTLAAGLTVPEGTYRLRVAGIDAAGRMGTADYEVDATLVSAGPLKMSALVLGLSRNGRFEPRLQFGLEPVAIAYIELYGRPAGDGARVALALELATTLNGPALLTVPGVLSATSEPDKFVVNAAVPIGALPAGDFVVRALVAVEGQAAGRVYRTFRKVQ